MLYKENKVPHYQRLYQRDDGVRLWMKVRNEEPTNPAGLAVVCITATTERTRSPASGI